MLKCDRLPLPSSLRCEHVEGLVETLPCKISVRGYLPSSILQARIPHEGRRCCSYPIKVSWACSETDPDERTEFPRGNVIPLTKVWTFPIKGPSDSMLSRRACSVVSILGSPQLMTSGPAEVKLKTRLKRDRIMEEAEEDRRRGCLYARP